GDREPVAHVDGAGVLARAHHDVRPLGRQQLEQLARVLVAAVLRPHQREDGKLEPVRLASELLADELVLGVGETELAVRSGGRHLGHAKLGFSEAEAKSLPPSPEEQSGLTACSGCGMRPTTFPASFATPAMSFNEPFGFWPVAYLK